MPESISVSSGPSFISKNKYYIIAGVMSILILIGIVVYINYKTSKLNKRMDDLTKKIELLEESDDDRENIPTNFEYTSESYESSLPTRPVQRPPQPPIQPPVQRPSQPPIQRPSQPPIQRPSQPPIQPPIQRPSQPPIQRPTQPRQHNDTVKTPIIPSSENKFNKTGGLFGVSESVFEIHKKQNSREDSRVEILDDSSDDEESTEEKEQNLDDILREELQELEVENTTKNNDKDSDMSKIDD